MATLKEALQYASQNPDSDFAKQLSQHIKTGAADQEAKSLGIDLTPIKSYQPDITQDVKPKQSLLKKIGTTLSESGNKSEAIIRDDSRGVISRGVGATAQGFMGAMGVIGNVLGSIPGVKKLEPVAQVVGDTITKGRDAIADNKVVQVFSQDLARSLGGEENVKTLADAGIIADTILSANLAKKGVTKTADLTKEGIDTTKQAFEAGSKELTTSANNIIDRISSPNVSDATRVSLNPVEALKGTGQDIRVTVGGKSKLVSELTPDEISKLKISTSKSMDSFTKQAEGFKNNRSVEGGSPVEMVGSRADKALQYADSKRQVVGQKMGEIENKYASEVIPLSKPTIEKFSKFEEILNNSGYGKGLSEIKPIQAMVDDFVKLNRNGLTVAERNNFVRAYDKILRDATDAFGNFKENASAYTDMSRVLKSIKNETVDALTAKDKIYRGLRKQYAEHIKLQEFGDALLGKDGLLGERLKGAATVKRAIQSNSDAGARQFLAKLKEITGYDAIQQGDLALTAMKNIGDYQGLSLLNILQEGKGGLIKKALEKGQDIILGNEAQRVKKFINK